MLALVEALNDSDASLRLLAARTLADSGLPRSEVVPGLIVALDDPDPEVHQAVYQTLWAISGVRLAPGAKAWRGWWRDHL
jgi:HEAT repeat protein